jgi:hypothetical protein
MGEMFRLRHPENGDHRRAEDRFLLPSRFLRAMLWPPFGAAVRGAARALNHLWAPSALFDYLILFHIMKGYRQHLRDAESGPDRKRSSS